MTRQYIFSSVDLTLCFKAKGHFYELLLSPVNFNCLPVSPGHLSCFSCGLRFLYNNTSPGMLERERENTYFSYLFSSSSQCVSGLNEPRVKCIVLLFIIVSSAAVQTSLVNWQDSKVVIIIAPCDISNSFPKYMVAATKPSYHHHHHPFYHHAILPPSLTQNDFLFLICSY